MLVHLSFDHELFFGEYTGTLEKCILEPTRQLMELAAKHKIPLIFFVDAGYLVQLKKYSQHSTCKEDLEKVSAQISSLVKEGHQIGLHIHPHWEDCTFAEGKWNMNTKRYKLSDFSKEEAASIISTYQNTLSAIAGKKCTVYRAGGWCIQPFSHIKDALIKNGIAIDSSVYYNGYHDSPAHAYDFRSAKDKAEWKFENDCCVEDVSGSFKEIAITPDTIGPAFYWNLYFKMRTAPETYKPIGDGLWLKDKGRIYKQFHSSTDHFACADGYFSSRLKANLEKCEEKKFERMMVLSHPKSLAPCSFGYLDEFIGFAKQRGHQFAAID
jgi:hypothetical protein